MSHRWMKFWPQDWEGDTALRVVSLAAQGMWMRLICAMHRSDPYGHLTMNGRPMSVRQIASLASINEREAGKLLEELEVAGVLSRTSDGTIFSRRMVRDKQHAELGKSAVERRWARREGDADPNRDPITPPITPPNRGAHTPPNRDPNSLETEAESEADRDTSLRSVSLPRGKRAGSNPDFADFWAAYPRKVGKGAAEKAFAAAIAKGASVADIAAGLNRQRWPAEVQYIPHPATWLNGRRWEDDPGAAAPPPSQAEPPGKMDWLWRDMAREAEAAEDFPDFTKGFLQ